MVRKYRVCSARTGCQTANRQQQKATDREVRHAIQHQATKTAPATQWAYDTAAGTQYSDRKVARQQGSRTAAKKQQGTAALEPQGAHNTKSHLPLHEGGVEGLEPAHCRGMDEGVGRVDVALTLQQPGRRIGDLVLLAKGQALRGGVASDRSKWEIMHETDMGRVEHA